MLKKLANGYHSLVYYGNFLKSPLLLICRLYWGWLFTAAGWEKLTSISNFIQLLRHYELPFPTLLSYFAAFSEFLGGLCLILGFASRLASIPLIITMLVAYILVHTQALREFFSQPSLFVAEAPFNFLLTALLILAFGPGRFSLDYILEKRFIKISSSTCTNLKYNVD